MPKKTARLMATATARSAATRKRSPAYPPGHADRTVWKNSAPPPYKVPRIIDVRKVIRGEELDHSRQGVRPQKPLPQSASATLCQHSCSILPRIPWALRNSMDFITGPIVQISLHIASSSPTSHFPKRFSFSIQIYGSRFTDPHLRICILFVVQTFFRKKS